jgi:hypothetical protein
LCDVVLDDVTYEIRLGEIFFDDLTLEIRPERVTRLSPLALIFFLIGWYEIFGLVQPGPTNWFRSTTKVFPVGSFDPGPERRSRRN